MTETNRNVVFVSQHYPPDKGGNAARIHDIATHLSDQKWNVTVLAPPPSYPPGTFERSWQRKRTDTVEDVTVHRLWSWQPQTEDPSMTNRLAYYLLFGIQAMIWLLWNVRQYDAVVTTTPPISTGAPGLLAAALGKPWIVDVRDLWIDASVSLGYLEADSPIERVSRRFQRHVLHTADRITVTTETLGKSLQETYGRSLETKTVLLPNGVDVNRFRAKDDENRSTVSTDATSDTASNSRVESDGGRPTIIYTGNLGSAQDLESCIRAMKHLSHDSAVLRLVGGGDKESDLKDCTAANGLDDRVIFEGIVPREEVPALLTEATIGVAPLRDTDELAYAMPTKVYEYMACGLPTVVTGRGEIERIVEQSGGGVHVENDPEKIARTFDRLLADEPLRRQYGKNGRNHVEETYDRQVIARHLGNELTELVEEQSKRGTLLS